MKLRCAWAESDLLLCTYHDEEWGVPEHDGRILICKRAIEPRRGYWTIPAGFMENGETLQQAAARESQEEALADVEIGSLLSIVHVTHAHQVHVFFRATLQTPSFGASPPAVAVAPGFGAAPVNQFTPSSRPASRDASRKRTLRSTCWLGATLNALTTPFGARLLASATARSAATASGA